MLLALGIILAIAWLLLKFAWHIGSGFVYVLLILSVIALIVHFVRGSHHRPTAT